METKHTLSVIYVYCIFMKKNTLTNTEFAFLSSIIQNCRNNATNNQQFHYFFNDLLADRGRFVNKSKYNQRISAINHRFISCSTLNIQIFDSLSAVSKFNDTQCWHNKIINHIIKSLGILTMHTHNAPHNKHRQVYKSWYIILFHVIF